MLHKTFITRYNCISRNWYIGVDSVTVSSNELKSANPISLCICDHHTEGILDKVIALIPLLYMKCQANELKELELVNQLE